MYHLTLSQCHLTTAVLCLNNVFYAITLKTVYFVLVLNVLYKTKVDLEILFKGISVYKNPISASE